MTETAESVEITESVEPVAIVGAGRAGRATAAALARHLAQSPSRYWLAFQLQEGERPTAAEVASALGGRGAAFLFLPPGESGELGRALVARGVRVVDLGADQRLLPHVACALGPDAAGRRMLAMPSAGALAAWLVTRPLLEAGLLQGDRLSVVLLAGEEVGDATSRSAPGSPTPRSFAGAAGGWAAASFAGGSGAPIAEELSWLAGRPLRATCELLRVPIGRGLLAVVQGDAARDLDAGELRAALAATARSDWLFATRARAERRFPEASSSRAVHRERRPELEAAGAPEELLPKATADRAWAPAAAPRVSDHCPTARVCGETEWPDTARVVGTCTVELAAREDGFAERITALCALDAVEVTAGAALAALRRWGAV